MRFKNIFKNLISKEKLDESYFRSMQLPQELSGSNSDYRRFVILSHQRSGSSLLVRLLASHPSIVCFGELFVPGRIGFGTKLLDGSDESTLNHRNAYPIEFLDEFIYGRYREDTDAVGFKFFPEQAENAYGSKSWSWLKNNKSIRIIHLNRSDRLATYASLMMAKKTGAYGITDPKKRSEQTLSLDPSECEKEFAKRDKYEHLIDEDFKDHEKLKLDYNDLTNQMNRVQSFLGVELQSLETDKVKQEVRGLDEVIENYHELKEHFSETKWSVLFNS